MSALGLSTELVRSIYERPPGSPDWPIAASGLAALFDVPLIFTAVAPIGERLDQRRCVVTHEGPRAAFPIAHLSNALQEPRVVRHLRRADRSHILPIDGEALRGWTICGSAPRHGRLLLLGLFAPPSASARPRVDPEQLRCAFDLIEHAVERWATATGPIDTTDPILLMNRRGGIVRASAAARQLIAGHDLLSLNGASLDAKDRTLDAAIKAALRASEDDADTAQHPVVSIPETRRSLALTLTVAALDADASDFVQFHVARIARLLPTPNLRLDVARAARRFGFTERERQCAVSLLEGANPSQIAELMGISRNTVRVHIQALLRKAGVGRQAELLRKIFDMRENAFPNWNVGRANADAL